MEQIGIALFGVLAIWLSQDQDVKRRRFAPIFGLISQPFWFYTSFINQQWGVFFLSFLYAYCWWRGIKTYWLSK